MESRKLKLRKDILDSMEIAKENGSKLQYINVAIKYGLYRSMGGEKAIALPPYCDVAIKTVFEVSKLLLSNKEIGSEDIENVLNNISSYLNIADIGISNDENVINIYLVIMGTGNKAYNMHIKSKKEQLVDNLIYIVNFGLSLVCDEDFDSIVKYTRVIEMNLKG